MVLESLESRCLLAPLADIVDVSPDPRNGFVGEVVVRFQDSETGENSSVTGVDLGDFELSRNGIVVPLDGVSLSGSGSTYTLDLTSVTAASGKYVLTLVASQSGIHDEAGNLLGADAQEEWVIDDRYEENDTLRAAKSLGRPNGPAVIADLILADANDWYAFSMTAKGKASSHIAIHLQNGEGDLEAQLFNAAGKKVRSSSAAIGNEDRVSLRGLFAGSYYLRVFGKNGAASGYALSLDVPQKLVDDVYEQNDTRSAARSLGSPASPLTIANLVMADAHDWYRFTTKSPGTSLDFVRIDFQHAQGNLNLQLYSSSGAVLRSSTGSADSEQVSLADLPAGTYFIHVFGASGAKNPNYALHIDAPDIPPPPPGSTTFDITLSMSGLTAEQEDAARRAAQKWESVIVGELPNATYFPAGSTVGIPVDDILIEVSVAAIDGAGNTLADTFVDRVRTGSSLPYHAFIRLDSADLPTLSTSRLLATIFHEMGHALGFGTIWAGKGLLLGAGSTATGATGPRFVGPKAVAAYNEIFGLTSTFVPVENTGAAGVRDTHWRETTFGNEVMTSALGTATTFPLSRITVASMADLGYTVDMAGADDYIPPGIPVSSVLDPAAVDLLLADSSS